MSEEGQEVASSSNNRFNALVALGKLSKGRAASSVGAVVERLEKIRQAGRLTDRENGELVDLVVHAVSEAYRVTTSRPESVAEDTKQETQLPRASKPAVRRIVAIDYVRCKVCKEILYGVEGHISNMACQNLKCHRFGLQLTRRQLKERL